MSYFNIPCLNDEAGRKLLILANILLILLGAMDGAYAGVTGQLVAEFKKFAQSMAGVSPNLMQAYEENRRMIEPPIVFFSVAGFIEVVSSVIFLLVIFEVLGKSGRSFWIKVLLLLSVSNFAFNLAIAIYSSLTATYWNYLNKDFMDQNYSPMSDYVIWLRASTRFVNAEAVITFVLNLPLAGLILVGILNSSLKQEADGGQHNKTIEQLKKDQS